MKEYVKRCGHMARMFSLGESVEKRHMWVLEIADNPGVREPEPNYRYVGNVHGDEPTGRCAPPASRPLLCGYRRAGSHWCHHRVGAADKL
jgi:Zinc carboxypeptidase